ncbi:regulatory protein GemA [Pseudoalteromonas sp. MM17-2]|uniref:gp16 family protein n=1 Tax=Pseudoalteromonas TaxID=53246 RepID=UPI001EF6BCA4|nr:MULTISPECIES: regulatory protein GemA [Pseudoalteromonas]MCG7545577.1 regulatory protein GemA [Pseudoalteromonas sp. MM17-2]|tara:strand:- start:15757 stop:16236 length:480 start_codon:yes stop_codon:yes gene_type:complete
MRLSKSRYIQLIHIAKNQLQLDDELYRQVLQDLTKKQSCKDMSVSELDEVLEHFKSKGFKPVSKKGAKGLSPMSRHKKPGEKTQLDKLRQTWIEMHRAGYIRDGSEVALLNWSKAQAKRWNKGIAVERLEWLTPEALGYLIEQLKRWHVRATTQEVSHE